MQKLTTALKLPLLTLLSSVFLVSCSTPMKEISITTIEEPRPQIVLPTVDQFNARMVEFIIVTPNNIEEIYKRLEDGDKQIALFALTPDGYQNISLNMADIIKLIEQQKSIIAAYKHYYEEEN